MGLFRTKIDTLNFLYSIIGLDDQGHNQSKANACRYVHHMQYCNFFYDNPILILRLISSAKINEPHQKSKSSQSKL